ncbi:MAG TPA: CsbD family protein [Gammaproteobacteria bacterium]|nr:CsbD family protein [Gammaproteobacteria bacterium]
MNKDQVKGELKKGKGKVKEATGRAIDNDEMEREGKREHAKGTVQNTYGDAKSNVKKATK